jgi:hypothetical protein
LETSAQTHPEIMLSQITGHLMIQSTYTCQNKDSQWSIAWDYRFSNYCGKEQVCPLSNTCVKYKKKKKKKRTAGVMAYKPKARTM